VAGEDWDDSGEGGVMISTIMFYVFGLFIAVALIFLVTLMSYEKRLKVIEHDERGANPDVIPLVLTIRIMKRFSRSHPLAGFVYRYSFYYMLLACPALFLLMVLEYIL
jgi:hypothetical protein